MNDVIESAQETQGEGIPESSETQKVLFDLFPLENSVFYNRGDDDMDNTCQDPRVLDKSNP